MGCLPSNKGISCFITSWLSLLRVGYITVWVQKTWGPKCTLVDLACGLKIGHKLEDWILKLEECFLELGLPHSHFIIITPLDQTLV